MVVDCFSYIAYFNVHSRAVSNKIKMYNAISTSICMSYLIVERFVFLKYVSDFWHHWFLKKKVFLCL